MASSKTTGAEFKRFLDEFPNDQYIDDDLIYVDGVEFDGPYEDIPDAAYVNIAHGTVNFHEQTQDGTRREPKSLPLVFNAWRRQQGKVSFVVTVHKDRAEAVKKAIKECGGSCT